MVKAVLRVTGRSTVRQVEETVAMMAVRMVKEAWSAAMGTAAMGTTAQERAVVMAVMV